MVRHLLQENARPVDGNMKKGSALWLPVFFGCGMGTLFAGLVRLHFS